MDLLSKIESFYSVNYGPSINMSNVSKMISVMKTYVFVVYRTKRELKCQNKLFFEIEFLWKHQSLCFHYWDYLMNVWRTNWQSIIDLVEKLCYNNIFRSPNIIQSTKFLLCTVIDFSKRSVHFDCLPYNMYYMKGGLMYLIRNNLQNYTKISNLWLLLGFYYMYWSYYTYWSTFFLGLSDKMDVFSKKINHCALWKHQLGASWMGGIHCCTCRVSICT